MKQIAVWFKVIFMTFVLTSTIWMDTLLFPFRKKRSPIPQKEPTKRPDDLNDLQLEILIQNYRLQDLELFLIKVADYTRRPSVKKFDKIKLIAEGLLRKQTEVRK